MDNQVVSILLEIQKDCAATKQAVEALAGPEGRVTKLERSADRQFWYTAAVVPFIGIAHAIVRRLGVNI